MQDMPISVLMMSFLQSVYAEIGEMGAKGDYTPGGRNKLQIYPTNLTHPTPSMLGKGFG